MKRVWLGEPTQWTLSTGQGPPKARVDMEQVVYSSMFKQLHGMSNVTITTKLTDENDEQHDYMNVSCNQEPITINIQE